MPGSNSILRALGSEVEHLKPHLSPVTFNAGDVIKCGGEHVERVYFPSEGLVSAREVLRSGHEIECALIGRTNAVGVAATLGFVHVSTRYVCLTDGQAWKISLPHLVSAMFMRPSIDRRLKLFCFAQMGYAVHVGVCNALHGAEQRVARWLANAAELLGRPELIVGQEELATGLGLQRSSVNPVLQRLKADRLVEVTRGRIVILDPVQLGQRACECQLTLQRALFLADAAQLADAAL